jgi:hypothetical protein
MVGGDYLNHFSKNQIDIHFNYHKERCKMEKPEGMLEIVMEAPNKISITFPEGEGKPVRVNRYVSGEALMNLLVSTPNKGDGMTIEGWGDYK